MSENPAITISESMQMYLITIARLWGDRQPVPLSKLAHAFSISPVSVNEMCRKLQDNGLVNYQPYKGATLTPEGAEKANYIIRRHRLWEAFLTKKLGFAYEEAHEMACQFEHCTPDILADRLTAFLRDPAPSSPEGLVNQSEISLDQLTSGQKGIILGYEFDENTQKFLQKAGVVRGVHITILATSDEGLLIQLDNAKTISVSSDLAHAIVVTADHSSSESDHRTQSDIPHDPQQTEVIEMQNNIDYQIQEEPVVQLALNKLKIGQRGIVVRVGGKSQLKQRMMDMGLVPGTEVQVVRVAPLGNPMEFLVKGYHLSLRKNESSEIEVEVIE